MRSFKSAISVKLKNIKMLLCKNSVNFQLSKLKVKQTTHENFFLRMNDFLFLKLHENVHVEHISLSLTPCAWVLIKRCQQNWEENNIFQTLIKAQYHIVYFKLSFYLLLHTHSNAPTCIVYIFTFLLHRSRAFRYKYVYDKCNDAACIFMMLCKNINFELSLI